MSCLFLMHCETVHFCPVFLSWSRNSLDPSPLRWILVLVHARFGKLTFILRIRGKRHYYPFVYFSRSKIKLSDSDGYSSFSLI